MKKTILILSSILATGLLVFFVATKIYRQGEADKAAQASNSKLAPAYSPVKGPASAVVTLVEFFDPQCEACRAFHPVVEQVMSEFGDKVRLVMRYMPYHGHSVEAALALEAARDQGKYWDALDALFEGQESWGGHHGARPELLYALVEGVGVDAKSLKDSVKNKKHIERIEQDKADGEALGVRGTPTFFVNGKLLERLGAEPLRQAIRAELR